MALARVNGLKDIALGRRGDAAEDCEDFRSTTQMIYKICPLAIWSAAERDCVFRGAGIDRRDGYIHFSTADQLAETAARHFAGQTDLILVAVDEAALAGGLRWEPARGGALFPHLYGDLPLGAVCWTKPLPLGPDGRHVFPDPLG